MGNTLDTEITNVIDVAEEYCSKEGLSIELFYSLPDELLETISKRSKELPSLYFVSKEMLQKRLENGCFLIKKGATQNYVLHRYNRKRDCLGWILYINDYEDWINIIIPRFFIILINI